ncbi:MAG: ketoacyl-ACP synthase III [Schwartzia sp.]|nr:ketoacyl-ACP synthase III [Schwartzia sp. (in: firmicutes)]
MKACLKAIACELPAAVEDNEFLVRQMALDWPAEDIYAKTGIRQRHIAAPDECASDLAARAAERLFRRAPALREKTDFLLFCSQSPDYVLPATACLLQQRLGLSTASGALDINQGCSGFLYGLAVAKGLIESGTARNVLLLMAETYSKYLAPDDKTTRPIFGDGAAAVWIAGEDTAADEPMGPFVLGTDGTGAENLIVRGRAGRREEGASPHLFMDGPEIFQFTLRAVPKTARRLLEASGCAMEEIDYFVFHQANAFMLEHLRKKLKIPPEKFCLDLADTGNTVSASIPIALARALERGAVRSGMRVMLMGFGVGYSWGGCLIRIP